MAFTYSLDAPVCLQEFETKYGVYQIWDTVYANRSSRVLYSGRRLTAQSGIAFDASEELLFDYNQRFLEMVLGVQPTRCLIIGGGMYTLPRTLQTQLPKLRIDIVELDPELIIKARELFDFKPKRRTTIYHQTGRSFLESSNDSYDCILIDAFIHAEIPKDLIDGTAAKLYAQQLSGIGVLGINCIASYHGRRSSRLKDMIHTLRQEFDTVQLYPAGTGFSLWLPQNFIVVATNNPELDISSYLRFAAIDDSLHV